MDSHRARVLFSQHAHAMAYVDVEKPDGARSIGSAFHIGDGVFVTARHVVGVHWDDWVPRGLWNLSDAIVLGYPPLPMSNAAVLIAARAEIHTFIVPRHVRYVHFILSAIPRGGFSGGVAIHEDGDALGVITSSLAQGDEPEHFGFLAVLSVEAIVDCLMRNKLYPEVQRQYHQSLLGLDPMKWIAPLYEDRK